MTELVNVIMPMLLGFAWGYYTRHFWRIEPMQGVTVAFLGGGALGLAWVMWVSWRLT